MIGPYVQGVTKMCIDNPEAIRGLIEQGNENRKTGVRQSNGVWDHYSRSSHAFSQRYTTTYTPESVLCKL